MRIVLTGALPASQQARELTTYLQETSPHLVAMFERSRATRIVADPATTWCTAWEYWQLQDHGFVPASDQVMSAGLGPLLSGSHKGSADEIWLVELVHISPSRDGAVLIPARDLNITHEQSSRLFESAQSIFEGSGFDLYPCSDTHWRVRLPAGYAPHCPSPALVSTGTVNEWWTQDIEGRAWRRLANELQMLWFDHAVNRQRHENQQVPINAVWLFGGAKVAQLSRTNDPQDGMTRVDHSLYAPLLAHDWSTWLAELGRLDTALLSGATDDFELILTGHDRIIVLVPQNRFLTRLWPSNKDSWKKWWLRQD